MNCCRILYYRNLDLGLDLGGLGQSLGDKVALASRQEGRSGTFNDVALDFLSFFK